MEAVHGSFWLGNLGSKRPNGFFAELHRPHFKILEQSLIAIGKAQKTTEYVYKDLPWLKLVRLRLIASRNKVLQYWMVKRVVGRKQDRNNELFGLSRPLVRL